MFDARCLWTTCTAEFDAIGLRMLVATGYIMLGLRLSGAVSCGAPKPLAAAEAAVGLGAPVLCKGDAERFDKANFRIIFATGFITFNLGANGAAGFEVSKSCTASAVFFMLDLRAIIAASPSGARATDSAAGLETPDLRAIIDVGFDAPAPRTVGILELIDAIGLRTLVATGYIMLGLRLSRAVSCGAPKPLAAEAAVGLGAPVLRKGNAERFDKADFRTILATGFIMFDLRANGAAGFEAPTSCTASAAFFMLALRAIIAASPTAARATDSAAGLEAPDLRATVDVGFDAPAPRTVGTLELSDSRKAELAFALTSAPATPGPGWFAAPAS
jgi:hypothetical protein